MMIKMAVCKAGTNPCKSPIRLRKKKNTSLENLKETKSRGGGLLKVTYEGLQWTIFRVART